MREVTIHLVPGQTDRDLERELLRLDPQAQVHRVSGRLGRTGVRVCAHLAARYLANELWASEVDSWGAEQAQTVPAEVEVTAVYGLPEPEATTEVSGAATEAPAPAPEPKKAAPAKKAAKKAAPAAEKKTEEV